MFCDAHRHTAMNYTDEVRFIVNFDVIRPKLCVLVATISCCVVLCCVALRCAVLCYPTFALRYVIWCLCCVASMPSRTAPSLPGLGAPTATAMGFYEPKSTSHRH